MVDYKFGIIGVGPIGSIMAAHLAKVGHNVTLIDIFKEHLNEIKKNGLLLTGFKEMKANFPPENFCYSIDEMDGEKIDVIFISLKASILPKIIPNLKKVVKPGTIFISLQNGLDAEELIADTFGKNNTLRIVINYAGNVIDNGKVRMSFFNAPNYIGMIDSSAEKKGRELAEIITSSDMETKFTSEIKKYEWEKTILNTALSPVCALTRRTMKQMMEFKKTRDLVEEILIEGIEVAKANGILFESDFLKNGMEYLDKAGHHKTSMHVDIERGSPTEISFINGKIVEYGKLKGIPTPYNSTIVSLIMGSELPEYMK